MVYCRPPPSPPFLNRKFRWPSRLVPQIYLHGNHDIPIYCKISKLLSTEECINIILDPKLTSDVVCNQLPIAIDQNSVFVVDMSKLAHPKDIVCDDMGCWKWGGSYRIWLEVDDTGGVKVLGKEAPGQDKSGFPAFRIWKRYYTSKSSPDLRKLVVTIEGKYFSVVALCSDDGKGREGRGGEDGGSRT